MRIAPLVLLLFAILGCGSGTELSNPPAVSAVEKESKSTSPTGQRQASSAAQESKLIPIPDNTINEGQMLSLNVTAEAAADIIWQAFSATSSDTGIVSQSEEEPETHKPLEN